MTRKPNSMSKPSPASLEWTATNSEGFASPVGITADIVVFTVRDRELLLLTVERPDQARALPGGFVGIVESAEQTAERILRDKTGLDGLYLEQLASFTTPTRDPRGWIPTVAFIALVPPATEPNVPDCAWVKARRHSPLAFDHDLIVDSAIDRITGKLWWSNIAVGVLPGMFTLAEARDVYQAIASATYDPSTFGRDLRATGLIVAANELRTHTVGRPAQLYEFESKSPVWGVGRKKRVQSRADR